MTTAVRPLEPTSQPVPEDPGDVELRRAIDGIISRRPAVALMIGVVRPRKPPLLHGHGLADIDSNTPVSEDTVFRIGSVTKLFTAIAVMQLVERRRIDLDAPANDYLRAYRLVPADPAWRPATLRHLLTHSAGIPEVRGLADLLHADFTLAGGRPASASVTFGERLPSLATYYRSGLRIVVEPGTSFAYTNHGWATVGQIVEDVSGQPLDRYFREHIFEPLGMVSSDLVRSERVAARLATGYAMRRGGPKAVPDREWIDAGAGQVYSTARDIAIFAAALLAGGANEHGSILEPASLAAMFEAHFQPDPRIPGMGLGFFRGQIEGRRVVGHDGILPGFNSTVLLAPDDGVGLVAFTNGSSGAFSWLQIELDHLLRQVIGLRADVERVRAPHHPERWAGLCGGYVLQPRIADLRGRLMLSGGVEVFVGSGRLMVRLRTPVPLPLTGLPLEPDDALDPDVFRLDVSRFGMAPVRVVFSRDRAGRATAAHTDLGGQPWSFVRRGEPGTARRWAGPMVAAIAAAGLAAARRRRDRRRARPRHDRRRCDGAWRATAVTARRGKWRSTG